MSKDKPSKPPLSGEDAELWKRVAGTTQPLKKPANRFVKRPDVTEPDATSVSGKKKPGAGKPTVTSPAVTKPAVQPGPPPLGSYDRGEARAVASGRREIDAKIDLHGMRQREAHHALISFIHNAQARGHRHVLVITGKGGRRDDSGSFERGVLNREVPRWLNEPQFRQMVVGFTPAHKRHGGEGALYVRLRRADKITG